MIVLLGASGYIGQAFAAELVRRNLMFLPLSRRDMDYSRFEVLLKFLRERLNLLTAREREVFPLVVTGRPNKQIAVELALSEKTVKVHRGQIMKKMNARSLVDLVRIADALGISTGKS